MSTKLCLGAVLSAFACLALAAQAPNSVALSLKALRGDGLNVAGSGWVKYATSCDSKFILMLELN